MLRDPQKEGFIPKELTVKVKGKHLNRINIEHQDQISGRDIGAQGNHSGWGGQGMLCRDDGSWAGSSRIGHMCIARAQ